MNPLFDRLSSEFLPRFLSGLAVNFEIAGIAIALGLVCGILLAMARVYGGAVGAAAATMIALMRAAPTFVVMFFLLNVIPRNASLFGVPLVLSGVMAVALSLLPYAAAYIADAGVEALQQLRRGSPLGSLLFLPNVTRTFFCWSCHRAPVPRSACRKASPSSCAKPNNCPRSATSWRYSPSGSCFSASRCRPVSPS